MPTDLDALQSQLDRIRLELDHVKAETGKENISIGNYLLTRLAQLRATSMFGVPGDFNLAFLDLVEAHPDIDWVGNCNELNAAYAADGYARVKEGSIGVITTTFGVGELSAINGIAGAFSEMVPVLHIAGAPSTVQQKTKPLLHHTLGDGRFDAYSKAAALFTISQGDIVDKENAAATIDRVITDCITQARPAYLTLPTDMVFQEISSERLKIPLTPTLLPHHPEIEDFVINLIHEQVAGANGDVVVLVDVCVVRHGVRKEVVDFVHKTGFPVYAAPMGKTVIDETDKHYGGIYVGSSSDSEVKEKVENAGLVISIGALASDFNTGNFSYKISTEKLVELHAGYTQVQYARFDNIGMKILLPKLAENLKRFYPKMSKIQVPAFVKQLPHERSAVITHSWFWPRLSYFFKPKDVIVSETGTSNFGILDTPLPTGAIWVCQPLWGSIGWSVGSCLGVALAARDLGLPRVLLFVGDGSLQLTVQELAPMIRKGLKPIIFVLNNNGYTIERFIRGKESKYNDISNWKWTSLLDAMNDSERYETASYTVEDKNGLSNLLDDPTFAQADKIQIVEVIMETLDAPLMLQRQLENQRQANPTDHK